jgi:hypothetical protein
MGPASRSRGSRITATRPPALSQASHPLVSSQVSAVLRRLPVGDSFHEVGGDYFFPRCFGGIRGGLGQKISHPGLNRMQQLRWPGIHPGPDRTTWFDGDWAANPAGTEITEQALIVCASTSRRHGFKGFHPNNCQMTFKLYPNCRSSITSG